MRTLGKNQAGIYFVVKDQTKEEGELIKDKDIFVLTPSTLSRLFIATS